MMNAALAGAWVCVVVGWASGFSSGNVGLACDSMTPIHLFAGASREPSPYEVYAEPQGDGSYIVSVFGRRVSFKGLMVQARTPGGDRVGKFTGVNNGQILDCGYPGGAVSHQGARDKQRVQAKWEPGQYRGPVNFRATVVRSYTVYWSNLGYSVMVQ